MFKFHTARTLTSLYLVAAVVLSFTHIADLFGILGSGHEKWIAPLLIDSVAIIGKISMGEEFSAKTRRAGRNAFLIAGALSLTANVTVGYLHQQYGSMILGLIVVAGAIWAETHLANLKPKATRTVKVPAAAPAAPTAAPAPATGPSDEQRAKWAEAGRKAAATRKANKAKAEAAAAAKLIPAQRTGSSLPADTRAYL